MSENTVVLNENEPSVLTKLKLKLLPFTLVSRRSKLINGWLVAVLTKEIETCPTISKEEDKELYAKFSIFTNLT